MSEAESSLGEQLGLASESPVSVADLFGEAVALHSSVFSSSSPASIDYEAPEKTRIIHILALICYVAYFNIQHKRALIWSLFNHRNMKQLEFLWFEGLKLNLDYEIGLK